MKKRKHLHPFWRRAAASFLILLFCLPPTPTVQAVGVPITPLVEFDPGSNPAGLAYGPAQSLWASLSGTGAIGQAASAPQIHPLPDAALHPWEITLGADQALWFTLENRDAIGRLDASGAFTQFALDAGISGAGGLALGQDRALWFTEPDANRIGRLAPGGEITHFDLPGENRRPMSILAAPNGDLWFTEWGGYSIGKITLGGEISEYDLPERYSRPADLLFGPEGGLWVTYNLGKRIARFDPVGETFTQYTLATQNPSLADLTLGPDQRIWYLGTRTAGSFEVINGAPANLIEEPLPKPIYSYQGRSQIIAGPDNNLIFTLANSNTIYQSPLPGVPLLRDLQVFITSSPTQLLTTGEFQLDGEIVNWTNTDAAGVEISLTLDENIHLVRAEVPGATCTDSGLSVTCSLPSLGAGISLPVRFVLAADRLANNKPARVLSLSVTSAEGDYQPSNNRVVLPLTLHSWLEYFNDFSQGADDHWSPALSSSPVDGLDVLGPFDNDEVTFHWDHLPPHDRARLCFDLYILGPWGGSQPLGEDEKTVTSPHLWASYANTNPGDPSWQQLTLSSFSNLEGYQQSFPAEHPLRLYPAQAGSSRVGEFDGLPATRDARYFICYPVEHSSPSLQLLLKGLNLNAAHEKWAVDNARIKVYFDAALVDRVYFPFMSMWKTGSLAHPGE